MNASREDDQTLLKLAGTYAAPDRDAWMAIVEKSLGGKPYDKLSSRTYDGIPIKPLYTETDDGGAAPPPPGTAPFVRGSSVLGNTASGWDVRCLSSHPDPIKANRQILNDLEKGATSVWLKLDPTGRTGTMIKCKADMAALLDGVYLDLAPVVLDPGGPSLPPAAYLMTLLEEKEVSAEAFAGNFGADPLSTLAAVGKVIVPMDTLLGRMADLAAHVSATYPNARGLNITTAVYHSAGCSEAQELAIAMATAVTYLREMIQAGLSIDEASRQCAFTLTCDADIFLTAAKFRAARRLWARIAEASGASAANHTAPMNAVTAPRMMSQRDPWVNVLRGTAACFGAAIGGADAVTVLPFESAIGLPTRFGRRIARSTQIILQEESGLSRVADPGGGAWMLESVTDDLAEKAWSEFQTIESEGGMTAALDKGSIAERIAETEVTRERNIATRKDPITGVSEFPDIAEPPVQIDQVDLDAIGAKADDRAAQAGGTAENLPGHGKGTLMAALVETARNDASAASIGAALRGSPLEITPLPQHRLAEQYEALRDAGDRWKAGYGKRPGVFLANIGRVADFTARASFAKNFFEAGGFDVTAGAGGDAVADIAADFKNTGASLAVICSSDEIYGDTAPDLAKALKDCEAAQIYLAGRPGEAERGLRDAGVDDFVYIGCDVLAVLTDAQTALGVRS